MEDLESARFVKFMDGPSWPKSLAKKDIKYCEKEYGPLARDFAELAKLVRQTDRMFNEQFSRGQVPSRNDYVGLTFGADFDYWDDEYIPKSVPYITVDLTKNTFRPVFRVHYSVLFLKPEIERILGVIAANSSEMISRVIAVNSLEMISRETLANSFYLDLCKCFQFVEEEKCSSSSLTITDDNSKPKIAKWHYEGNSIKDGRRRIEGIIETIEKWQGLSLLCNSTMQNSDKAQSKFNSIQNQIEYERNASGGKAGGKKITWIFAKTSHFIWAIIIATVGSLIATILIRYFW